MIYFTFSVRFNESPQIECAMAQNMQFLRKGGGEVGMGIKGGGEEGEPLLYVQTRKSKANMRQDTSKLSVKSL